MRKYCIKRNDLIAYFYENMARIVDEPVEEVQARLLSGYKKCWPGNFQKRAIHSKKAPYRCTALFFFYSTSSPMQLSPEMPVMRTSLTSPVRSFPLESTTWV